jgi:hypothetical protein
MSCSCKLLCDENHCLCVMLMPCELMRTISYYMLNVDVMLVMCLINCWLCFLIIIVGRMFYSCIHHFLVIIIAKMGDGHASELLFYTRADASELLFKNNCWPSALVCWASMAHKDNTKFTAHVRLKGIHVFCHCCLTLLLPQIDTMACR